MKACDIVSTAWGSRFMGRHFPSSIGRNGLTTRKREGDGASPVGTHRIVRGADLVARLVQAGPLQHIDTPQRWRRQATRLQCIGQDAADGVVRYRFGREGAGRHTRENGGIGIGNCEGHRGNSW